MIYHCPDCNKELQKGQNMAWVGWCIGPLFGQLLRPLQCSEHGEIDIERLSTEEKQSMKTRRAIGICVGLLVNIIVIVLIILYL